jgi:hypothetical protein
MIPTAEKFLSNNAVKQGTHFGGGIYYNEVTPEMLVEFAKLHVEAALKASANEYYPRDRENFELIAEKFLNAYPLTKIK